MKKYFNLIALAILAVISRFLFLSLRPFDGDEGIIIKIAQSPTIRDLLSAVSNDVHPPLFHFLEFLVLKILPLSENSVRLVSALSGVVAIYFIYLFFRKISSAKIALGVSLLSIINPVLSYHFAEARPYGLLVLLVFAQLYFFAKIKDNQSAKSENNSDLIWFTIFSILMALTQYISFAVFAGEILFLWICEGINKFNWKKIVAMSAVATVFAALWGKVFLSQLLGRTDEQSQALNLKANLTGLFNAVYRFFAGRLYLDLDPSPSKNLDFAKTDPVNFVIFALSVVVPLALLVWGFMVLYRKKRENFWLITIVFAPVVLAAALSSEIGPRAVRYLLFLAPFAIYILLEAMEGKRTIFKNILFVAAIYIYIVAFINGFYHEKKKPGVDRIAQVISEEAKPGDRILVVGGYGGGESLILKYLLAEKAAQYNIEDFYGNYKVGNLDEIKNRSVADEISKLKNSAGDNSVWFYDLTYTFNSTKTPFEFQKFDLGKDKENKELVLYKF